MTVVHAKSKTTEATHNAKSGGFTASEMQRRHQDWLDQVESTVLCAFCPGWSFTGPAVEARAAASLHREEHHPHLDKRKRRTVKRDCKVPGCVKHCKPGSDRCWDHATVKETAGADRPAEAAVSSTAAVLGEVAAVERLGPDGVAASPNTDERTAMECKIEGCTNDASDAPRMGGYASKCAVHRAEMAERRRGPRTGGGNASRRRRIPNRVPNEVVLGVNVTKAEALLAAARNVDEAEKLLAAARVQLSEAADALAV